MVPALVSSEHAETVAAIRSFASPHSISDLIGILCFLPERDNLLMWSHYADSHKGYALEFKASRADFKRLGPMWRVLMTMTARFGEMTTRLGNISFAKLKFGIRA